MYKFPPPILNRKIRIAVIGCGRIAKNHFSSITKHADDLELVGVCDVDQDARSQACREFDTTGYDTLVELVAKAKPDLVVLATPSGLHSGQAIELSQLKVNVMTEKPMATNWQSAKRMVDACDNAGVRLFVVKQNRRNATLQLVKTAMEQKRFGRLFMVNVNVFWTRPQEYYDSAKWRGTWEYDGGALMNQASHYIDLLDWIVGPVESLQAYTATLARNIEVEDTGVISVKWRSGALGSVNVTMLTYPKNLEGSITILGEKGSIKVGGVAVNEIQHWEFADQRPEDEKIGDASYATTSVYGFGHPTYYKNVIDVLRGHAEPETDGREGLKSLELLIASYMSARDGKRVSLPLEF